jgi:hypothetical protein
MAWAIWSIAAICMHTLMALFGLSYTLILWWMRQQRSNVVNKRSLLASAMFPLNVTPPFTNAYKEALHTRPWVRSHLCFCCGGLRACRKNNPGRRRIL